MADLTHTFSTLDAERIVLTEDDELLDKLRSELLARKAEIPNEAEKTRRERGAMNRLLDAWLQRVNGRLERLRRGDLAAQLRLTRDEVARLRAEVAELRGYVAALRDARRR